MADGALRLALFDCDGTLIDSQHTIIESMAAAFATLGRDAPAADAVRRVVGLRLDQAIRTLAGAAGDLDVETAVKGYLDRFAVLHDDPDHHEPVYDGAEAALNALEADGWLLGIATGKSHPGLLSTLDRHGLRSRFVTLQTADRAAGKPSPDMVLRAIADTGVQRDRVVVIGDTGFDVQMAVNAGVASIGVGWGYHPIEALGAAGATGLADAFGQIVDMLNGMVPA